MIQADLPTHRACPGRPAAVAARALLAIAAVAVVALAPGCARPERAARPSLVIILVDTLRSDHTGPGGYHRDTTPGLDALAERGVVFTHFYSHAAVTRPSVATLFSSRQMSGHGVVSRGFGQLAPELPLLAEVVARAGFHTTAVVTNPQVHPQLGFDRGFADFRPLYADTVDPSRVTPADLVKTPATTALAAARAAIAAAGTTPFFAYLHLLDPHGPYTPPAATAELFVDPDYSGPVTGSIGDFTHLAAAGRRDGPDLQRFVDLYDGEIRSVDAAIADFVGWLESSGRLATTHVVVTADHGEAFMEHGTTGHGRELYQETVRVPLLWLGPGVPAGRRIDALTGLVDLAPTVVDVLGASPPSGAFTGRSLRPLWASSDPIPWRDRLLLEGPGGGSVEIDGRRVPLTTRSLVTDSSTVIATGCALGHPGWQEMTVYDRATDPGEQLARQLVATTVSPADAALMDVFEDEVAAALSGVSATTTETLLPAEDLERLRRLGYLGTTPGDAP